MTDIILICIVLFFSSFVQTTTGFGYAITATAFLPMFLPLTDCMMVTIICSFLIYLFQFIKYRKHINYRIVFLPLFFCLSGTLAGLTLLVNSDNDLAIKILGGFLVAASIYFLFFAQRIKIPNNRISASMAGLFSGLTGGFFNIGGPPLVLFYSAAAKDKNEYIATLQFFSVCMGVLKIAYLAFTVGIARQVLIISPFGIAASALGLVLGTYVFDKLSHKALNMVVYIFMVIAGIWYIIK